MVKSYFQAIRPEGKMKVKTPQKHTEKIYSVLTVIATIVRLFLKHWVVISFFALVRKLDQAYLIMIPQEEPKQAKWMRFERVKFEKKDTL